MGYDPLSSELWSARAVVVRPGGYIDNAAYGCEFDLRGVSNHWERGRLARIDGRLTLLKSGRDARSPKLQRTLSQDACCAAKTQMVRSKISFGAQGLLNGVPISQTPQTNKSFALIQ